MFLVVRKAGSRTAGSQIIENGDLTAMRTVMKAQIQGKASNGRSPFAANARIDEQWVKSH